jgi:hypothetical protein
VRTGILDPMNRSVNVIEPMIADPEAICGPLESLHTPPSHTAAPPARQPPKGVPPGGFTKGKIPPTAGGPPFGPVPLTSPRGGTAAGATWPLPTASVGNF